MITALTFLICYVLILWLARAAAGDRVIERVVILSFLVRVLLAALLFGASLWHWPVLRSLQTGPGFWAFGLDSIIYDYYADGMVKAWALGVELPNSGMGIEYFIVVSLVYKLMGSHPLNAIIINCWLAAVTGLLAARLAQRLFSVRTGRISAMLVGFWPSSLVWSGQLLKDSLCWCLIFTALSLIVTAVSEAATSHPRLGIRQLGWLIALGAMTIAMTRLRFYIGLSFSVAVLAAVTPAACRAWLRADIRRGLILLGIPAAVVSVMLYARTLEPWAFISPRHPELGHVRIAQQAWRQRDLERATAEYVKALALNSRCQEAYLGLATIMVQQGRFPQALTAYQGYLERDKDIGRRKLVEQIMSGIARLIERESSLPAVPLAATAPPPVVARAPTLPAATLGIQAAPEVPPASPSSPAYDLGATITTPTVLAAVTSSPPAVPPAATAPPPVVARAPTLPAATLGIQAAPEVPPALGRAALRSMAHQALENPPAPQDPAPVDLSRDASKGSLDLLSRGLYQIDDEARASVSQMTPESLATFRRGFVHTGGYSLMDAWSQINSPGKLLTYLPRALAIGLLAPFPWQWFDVNGSTGFMRVLAGIEMMLVYWLFPAFLVGSAAVLRQRRPESLLLLILIVCLAVPMSLVVANLGTLFRLRLQFLLPLLILGAAGDPVAISRGATQWVLRAWRGRLKRRPGADAHDKVPADAPLLTAMSETRS